MFYAIVDADVDADDVDLCVCICAVYVDAADALSCIFSLAFWSTPHLTTRTNHSQNMTQTYQHTPIHSLPSRSLTQTTPTCHPTSTHRRCLWSGAASCTSIWPSTWHGGWHRRVLVLLLVLMLLLVLQMLLLMLLLLKVLMPLLVVLMMLVLMMLVLVVLMMLVLVVLMPCQAR